MVLAWRLLGNHSALLGPRMSGYAAGLVTSSPAFSVQKWYACVANAKWMLNDVQNESFAEQLREKTRHYKDTDQELDFFLVCEPEWLDKQHPEEAKKVGRPCVALIGTDYTFMKCVSAPDTSPHWPACLSTC